ncbi:uncharacterized protein LOC144133396 isoform X1 [Amblyomma americanum]
MRSELPVVARATVTSDYEKGAPRGSPGSCYFIRLKVLPDEQQEIRQAFHGPVCEKSADCSSHAMETEAAVCIWQRNQFYDTPVTPLQFTKFLSDGDSKAYAAVIEADVYNGARNEKEDCTNRVAKRLGTALRKSKESLPKGEKLKQPIIQKL